MKINREAFLKLSPAEQHRLIALLDERSRVAAANPLIVYTPHSKQAEFHASSAQLKALFGGNQSGKTIGGVVDTLIQACDEKALPPHLRQYKKWTPPFKCRVVTPDLMGTMTMLQEKIRDWVPRSQLKGGGWDSAYQKKDRILRFENGSYLEFLSGDQERDKHGGATLHRVWYDEEPPQHIRNECSMRLVKHGGDEIFTMTPSLPGTSGWTQDAIWDRRDDPGVFAVRVDIEDNPYLDAQKVQETLAQFSKEELAARKEGKFVHFAGMVYPEFAESIHVVDEIEPSHLEGQQIVVGIDPGSRWTAVVFGAFDKNNDLLIFDEILLASAQDQSRLCKVFPDGVTVEIAAREIKEKCDHWKIKPQYLIDPSAQNRTLTNAENVEGEFSRFGIFCGRAQNQVQAGVLQIKRRMQRRGKLAPEPGLLITRHCRRLIWEIGRYRQKETVDQSFAVIKQDDHAVDAMRYVAMHRPWLTEADKPKTEQFYGWKDGKFHIPPAHLRKRGKVGDYGPSGQWA